MFTGKKKEPVLKYEIVIGDFIKKVSAHDMKGIEWRNHHALHDFININEMLYLTAPGNYDKIPFNIIKVTHLAGESNNYIKYTFPSYGYSGEFCRLLNFLHYRKKVSTEMYEKYRKILHDFIQDKQAFIFRHKELELEEIKMEEEFDKSSFPVKEFIFNALKDGADELIEKGDVTFF